MPTQTIHTLRFKDNDIYIAPDKVPTPLPEAVRAWELTTRPLTAADVIEIGRRMNQANLTNEMGRGDLTAIQTARGLIVLGLALTAWKRGDDPDGKMPVTAENIETLPPPVIRLGGIGAEIGDQPTEDELRFLLQSSPSSGKSTSATPA